MVVLSACTRPSFLASPEPGDELPAAVESRAETVPAVAEDATVALAERAQAPAPVVKEATEAIDLWRQIGQELTLQAPPRHRGGDPVKLLRYSRRHFTAVTAHSAPYLQHIYQELKRRKLPAEIALIPVLESGYNNAARSAGGTAGLWQFTAGTGRRYGLSQSAAFDGRHEVLAATDAALDYLESLGKRFDGDWLLAFAAYNCGERNVEQAVARNRRRGRPTDFWSLELPSVTRHYIPRLLALAEVVRNPAAHQVQLARIPGRPYFEPVRITSAVGLRHLARHSGLAADEFERLNAGYRQHTTIGGRANDVLVAFGHGATVAAQLASLPKAVHAGAGRYVVRAGDTLSHIAARHGVTVSALERANRLVSHRLRIGQSLDLPGSARVRATGTAPAARSNGGEHVVAHGDSLWTVARRNGTSAHALAAANGLALDSTLRIGQRLRLPEPAAARTEVTAAVPEGHGAVTHYRVQRGDSLWTIARRFKVSIASLKLWNEHVADGVLKPGERLVVQPPQGDDARRI